MAISKDEFRSALGRFATGVTVVTLSKSDQPVGMTVSAFSSLSLDPPLILICIDQRAALHPFLEKGSSFAVNILAEDQEHLSRRFASREIDRFEGVGYKMGVTGAPVLEGALAQIECRVVDSHAGGDHSIIIGEVIYAEVLDGKPLAYFRGGYTQLG
jgi:flavin reductase (DIM6/NTAB) family NADH-FMN oxidoreductase RutF